MDSSWQRSAPVFSTQPEKGSEENTKSVLIEEIKPSIRPSTPQELTQGGSRTSSVSATARTFSDSHANSTEADELINDWDGPDDPDNPRNWTVYRKWAATLAVSAFTFISSISSSMVAPAAEQISEEFSIHSGVTLSMVVSCYVLAYAVGPLVLSPLSEVYGRSRVLQIANLFFFAFNFACGFAQNTSQLAVFRFLSGLGGSAPLSVGGGTLSDIFAAEDLRSLELSSHKLPHGRWVFWSSTIADGIVQLFGLWFLQETYPPVLLERKAAKIRKQMDSEKRLYTSVRTVYQSKGGRSWKEPFTEALIRPFILFAQEPIIQLFGSYLALSYGTVYLTVTTLPQIYSTVYHEKISIVGLHYLALGLGFSLTSQINSRLLDRVYIYYKDKNGGVGKPEYRLPVSIPVSLVPDIGFVLIAAGIVAAFQAMQTYIVDAFTLYAASALAAVSCFRSLAGFAFPLFAPNMNQALGYDF
ncbi:unnamed protein product [Somion occarium]|uniref:Major facilitator superfamily (MFS) profile domain-containing protein n=1 Tax=Somion occarium TaxID=3059160 RepID=A0ABP1DVW8_9APHY